MLIFIRCCSFNLRANKRYLSHFLPRRDIIRNRLTSVPRNIFSGLTSLDYLWVYHVNSYVATTTPSQPCVRCWRSFTGKIANAPIVLRFLPSGCSFTASRQLLPKPVFPCCLLNCNQVNLRKWRGISSCWFIFRLDVIGSPVSLLFESAWWQRSSRKWLAYISDRILLISGRPGFCCITMVLVSNVRYIIVFYYQSPVYY